jgi:hypothetical protein
MFSNVLFLSEPNLSNHTSEYVPIGITKTHKEQNTSERDLKRDLSSIMNEKKSSFMLADLLTYESMAKLVTFEILHNQLSKSKIRLKTQVSVFTTACCQIFYKVFGWKLQKKVKQFNNCLNSQIMDNVEFQSKIHFFGITLNGVYRLTGRVLVPELGGTLVDTWILLLSNL